MKKKIGLFIVRVGLRVALGPRGKYCKVTFNTGDGERPGDHTPGCPNPTNCDGSCWL